MLYEQYYGRAGLRRLLEELLNAKFDSEMWQVLPLYLGWFTDQQLTQQKVGELVGGLSQPKVSKLYTDSDWKVRRALRRQRDALGLREVVCDITPTLSRSVSPSLLK
jgi:hypothetical protein